jgi:hypothetical protein
VNGPAVAPRVRRRDRPIVGWREWVGLPELGVAWVKAKVDTGARSSSLHAWDVDVDEARGVVQFAVHPFQNDDETTTAVSAPLVELRDVRSSNGEVETRPVIGTRIVIAGLVVPIELTLSARDEMGFRMLLGRTAIRRRFLIDPGRSFRGGGDRMHPPGG